MKKIAIAFILLLFLSGCGESEVRVSWAPPTSGGPIDHYVLVVDGNNEQRSFNTENTEISIKLKKGQVYFATVAGVSPNGVTGPFSDQSEPFVPH